MYKRFEGSLPLLALCVPLSAAHKLELETRYSTRDDTRTDSTRREAEWTARAGEKRGKTRWREGRGSGKEENKKREACELSERTLESCVWGKGEEEQHIHAWTHVNKEESRANCETTFIPNVDSSLRIFCYFFLSFSSFFFSLFLLLAFASFFFFSEASLEQRNSSKREEKLFHPCVLIICG